MPAHPPASSKERLRAIGLALGLVVGAGFGTLAELVDFGALVNLDNLPWSLSTVVTGGLVGWCFGPRTTQAEQPRAWLAFVTKQALASVIVGSFTVATLGAFQLMVVRTGDLGSIPVAIYAGASTGVLGIMFLGWLIAPIAVAAAALWNMAMAWAVKVQ